MAEGTKIRTWSTYQFASRYAAQAEMVPKIRYEKLLYNRLPFPSCTHLEIEQSVIFNRQSWIRVSSISEIRTYYRFCGSFHQAVTPVRICKKPISPSYPPVPCKISTASLTVLSTHAWNIILHHPALPLSKSFSILLSFVLGASRFPYSLYVQSIQRVRL